MKVVSEGLEIAYSVECVANNTEDTRRAKDTVCCARVMAFLLSTLEEIAAKMPELCLGGNRVQVDFLWDRTNPPSQLIIVRQATLFAQRDPTSGMLLLCKSIFNVLSRYSKCLKAVNAT